MTVVAERSDEEFKLSQWIEAKLGAKLISITRQDRWRPSWIATVERGGETLSLYVRGDRGHGYSFPLSYEATIMQVLEKNGIPVPHVYGMCDDPDSIIMTNVPGERQLSGLDDPQEKRRVVDEYIGHMAAMHAIDVAQFEKEGFSNPGDPGDSQQNYHRAMVNFYRDLKSRPEPYVEWVLCWMDRNVPRHRSERSFVTFDAGQFLVDQGRVSALYDFEMGHINDPMVDLAGWRVRHVFEPLQDLGYMYRKYESITGRKIDLDVINYHVMALSLAANLGIAQQLTEAVPEAGIWLIWEVSGARYTLSALADILGVELEKVERPEAAISARTPAARAMKAAVDALAGDHSGSYHHKLASCLADHLELVDKYGAAIDKQNLDDVAELLGRRPASTAEADRELEKFVMVAGQEYDRRLLQLFHRRTERLRMLVPDYAGREPMAPGDISPFLDDCRVPPLQAILDAYDQSVR